MDTRKDEEELTLVVTKACFGLPTACPFCLAVYIYLKFSGRAFQITYSRNTPNSGQIPYVKFGASDVIFNNERGRVLHILNTDIIKYDRLVCADPYQWLSAKEKIISWLADAVMYELWVASDGSIAHNIYYSELPWIFTKVLHIKQVMTVKKLLRASNAKRKEEIYNRATTALQSLSNMLGEASYIFEYRPTSLDAILIGYALFMLNVLPETSLLRVRLLEHDNLVCYAKRFGEVFIGKYGWQPFPLPSKLISDAEQAKEEDDDDRSKEWQDAPEAYRGKWEVESESSESNVAKYLGDSDYNWDGPPQVDFMTGYRVWDWDKDVIEKNVPGPAPFHYPKRLSESLGPSYSTVIG